MTIIYNYIYLIEFVVCDVREKLKNVNYEI